MATEEQQKDRDRLKRYIERMQLSCVMNNTKWAELRELMISASFLPRFRIKDLRTETDAGYYWDSDWYHHFAWYDSIEWVDIDPIRRQRVGHLVADICEDHSNEIESLLQTKSIPFERVGGYVRVYGYKRPAT